MTEPASREQTQQLRVQLQQAGVDASARDVLRLTQFVEQAGGIEAARKILDVLEELRPAA